MANVGTAKIEFEADTSGVSKDLEAKMDAALSKVVDAVSGSMDSVEADFNRAGSSFDSVADGAEDAGRGISSAFDSAAERASAALNGVDGDGFDRASSSATSAAGAVDRAFTDAASRAESSLRGVDGDGFRNASSSASSSATSISDRMGQAAASVRSAWDNTASAMSSSFRETASNAESAFSGLGGKLTAGAGGFMALAGASNVVSDAFAKNTSIEDTTAVLEVLTGSTETAKTTMDGLVESNWDTPIAFDIWADAGKTLIAFGMEADDVSDTVTALGEAGAASGEGAEGLQRLARAFGQSLATGTMQNDTLNQLMESGVPALDILANHYGVTAEEMKSMASEGLDAEEAVAVLTEGIMEGTSGVAGETAAFEGTMSKLAGTTSGTLANLGSAFINVTSSAIGPALEGVTTFAAGLTEKIYDLQGVIEWFYGSSTAAEVLRGVVVVLGVAFAAAFTPALVGVIRAAAGALRGVGAAVWAATGPVGLIIGAIAGLVAAFVLLWNRSEKFRDFWKGLWAGIQEAVAPVVDWITEKFELIKGAWGDLVSAFTSDGAVEGDGALGKLVGVDRANAILGTLQTVKGAWQDITRAFTSDEAVEGDGALGMLIGTDRANTILGAIQTVKGGWDKFTDGVTGAFDLIFKGDYTAAFRNAFGVEEDAPIIGTILTIRDTLMELPDLAQGVADILFRGDFTGLPFGLEEDSPIVDILFRIRDAVQEVWSRIQDLGGAFRDAAGAIFSAGWDSIVSIFGAIVSVAGSLWGAFKSIAGAVWDLVQALAPVLMPILKVVGAIIGGVIVGAFFALMGALRVVAGLFTGLAKVIGWLAENVLSPLIGLIATIVSWLVDKFAGALSWVADLLGSVFSGIGPALSGIWEFIQESWASFTEWLGEAWAGLQEIWAEYGQPVVDFVIGAFTRLWDFLSLVGRLIGAAFEVLWTGLGKAWEAWGQPVVDWVIGAFEFLWSGLEVVFGWVSAAWDFLWSGLQAAWSTFGQPVVDFVVAAFQRWWSGIQNIFGWFRDAWNGVWNFVSGIWASYGQPVINRVSGAFDWVKFQIEKALWNIRNYIDLAGFKIRALWAEYVQPMIDWVTDGFADLMDTIRGWKDNVIGWFSDAGSWLVDAGKNIIQGLIDGATSLLSNIGNFFLDVLPDWVKDPFKRALGIESPSKIFAGYGRDIGDGLVAGIRGSESAVASATGELAASAASNFDPGAIVAPVGVTPSVTAPAGAGGDMGAETTASLEGMTNAFTATTNVAAPAFTALAGSVANDEAATITPAMARASAGMTNFATTTAVQSAGVVSPAFTNMAYGIQNNRAGVIDPAFSGIESHLRNMSNQFPGDIHGIVNPAVSAMGTHLTNAKVGVIDPAFDGIRSGLSTVVGAFANGARDVGVHMETMRRNTADPVRFTMNSIFSDGLVEMWNSVSGMIGTKTMAKKYASFHTGGIMPGYTPGRDVHRFVSPTGGVLDLSGGEPVLRPEVGKVLGSDWVHGVNSAARAEGTGGVSRFLEHQHFANGGFMNFARGGYIPQTPFFGGGVSAIGRSHEAFVERFFPGIFTLTSANRSGDGGHHGTGRATDWQDNGAQWPTPASKALSRAIAATYPNSLELIHWPTDGWSNIRNGRPATYDAGTNAGHANHVHWATAGPVTADGISGALSEGAPINWDIDWNGLLRSMVADRLEAIEATAASFSAPGLVGRIPSGTWEGMRDPSLDSMAKSMEESWKVEGGEGAERWRPLAMQALQRHGYNPADYIDAMIQQIQIESRGIPNAWNEWDENWLRGTPSGGLLQVIEPTYRRIRRSYPEAFEGLPDDMLFPLTNLTAGVGAVRQDWGGPGNRWPTRDGYHSGGDLPEGQGWFFKSALDREKVLSPRQTQSFEQLVNWLDSTDTPAIRPTARFGFGGAETGGGAVRTREVRVTQHIHAIDPKRAGDTAADRLMDLII